MEMCDGVVVELQGVTEGLLGVGVVLESGQGDAEASPYVALLFVEMDGGFQVNDGARVVFG